MSYRSTILSDYPLAYYPLDDFTTSSDAGYIDLLAQNEDYQEILEKQIIKVNHNSFCQVVVLGSATFQPFMQLPASQRREIIEDLLDLQIFTTMNSLLKE